MFGTKVCSARNGNYDFVVSLLSAGTNALARCWRRGNVIGRAERHALSHGGSGSRARGRLIGGNLVLFCSLFCALPSTPYLPGVDADVGLTDA